MALFTAEKIPDVPISLGESVNIPVGKLPAVRRHRHSSSDFISSSKSRLPPAVATVPPDHIRGYVHSKRVNSYLVGNTLGEGSFAKVKEAFHILVGEKVAMKVIDKKKAQQDPYVAKNFRREAKLLQMVRHPNILHLMEVIETDTSFYLITELCSGGELMKHIYSKGRLDEEETRKYMRQIISAVDHLHRAGIIHRDLKVENMLLDGNMDIRIIDFGLSNEEYIQGENGMIHCSTQCGSPAYAAPELLGHKEYGPEVDIWSIGVNMYAMLTGCLPYTVEPFNITALHAKMLENKMNPIPDSLSAHCKSLLCQLLEANPEQRIKMEGIMAHPWINQGHALPFGPAPFPNTLRPNDINMDIVDHMVHILKVKQTHEELMHELMSNKATTNSSCYFLLSARLERYQKKYPPRRTRVRHKSNRISQDYGYYEDGDDQDDVQSIKSMPTYRISRTGQSRHSSRPTHVQLRDKKGREGPASRPISHPTLSEEPELTTVQDEDYDNHRRRSSLPHYVLNDQLKRFRAEQHTKKTSNHTRSKYPTYTDYKSQDSIEEHDPPYEMDLTTPDRILGPIFPPSKGMARNYSHGHALNQLRQDLKDKLHPPQAAWRSNPSSRNSSRHGSRIPSSTSRTSSINASLQGGLDEVELEDEEPIIFHPTTAHKISREKAITLPRNFSTNKKTFIMHSPESTEPRLPALSPPPPTRGGGRQMTSNHLPTRKNGFKQNNELFSVHTDLSIDEIMGETLRVVDKAKMREHELSGQTLNCCWKGIRFSIEVLKRDSVCQFKFNWFSGGDISGYKNLCEGFMRRLKLS